MANGTITKTCSISFDEALFSVAGIIAIDTNPAITGSINDAAIYSYPKTPNNINIVLDVYSNEELYSTVRANWFLICR